MTTRYGVFAIVLLAFAGCVELSQILGPGPGEPPAPNFNDNVSTNGNANSNGNDNADTNGNGNDNAGTNGNENDNANTNGNENDNVNSNGNENDNTNTNGNQNENDNAADEDDAIFGGVGDIPPLEGEVVTTSSGLKYIDITVGQGEMPVPSSIVTVNYVGWLTNGTEFDSGQTVQFALNGVIAGWTEGVGSMRLGGSRRLFIPPDLAYGENGSPPNIPPNATLVFDIDLLDIQN